MWFPWAASSGAIGAGCAVSLSGGYVIAAVNDVATYYAVGVLRHAIAATDSDYATAHMVEVEVPVEKNVVWEIDVNSTLATTDVGLYLDFTTLDTGASVDHGVSTLDHAFCVGYISATKGLFVLNIGPDSHTKA